MKTLLVDDHPTFRAGVAALLAREERIASVVEAGTIGEALAHLDRDVFGLAIVDVIVPETGGIAFVRELRARQPACRILGLSMVEEPIRVAEMLRAGANGYALKSQAAAELGPAVNATLDGERYLPQRLAPVQPLLSEPLPLDLLTPRERSVFELLVKGLGSRGVAEQLAVARRTIDEHRRRIMHKLGARSIVDLIRIAMRYGIDHRVSTSSK